MRCLRLAPLLARRALLARTLRACFHNGRTTPLQRALPAAYYRGGTSRALMLQPKDLPNDRAKWPALFRQAMGSPDAYGRQLDGMGAGISSLSKICLVEPTVASPDADIDFTFVSVGVDTDVIDVAGNCGNMVSAVGPFAYNALLLPPALYATETGDITVRIRNTNTNKVVHATFHVAAGQATADGLYAIDGVSGKGASIRLDFQHPFGSRTGSVLPTGRPLDKIEGYNVSCVDGANPIVFIRASQVGIDGTILPADFTKLTDKLAKLERIRQVAAVAMGIAPTEAQVPRSVPKIGLVSMASTHKILSGETLRSPQVDLVVRFISDGQPHRAIPLTAALTTAVAARIPGTIVEQLMAPDAHHDSGINIGHASGRLQVKATMQGPHEITPLSATVQRTAKRLFEGSLFWTDFWEGQPDLRPHFTTFRTGGTHSLGMAFVLESRGLDSRQLLGIEPGQDEAGQDKVEEAQSEQGPPLIQNNKSAQKMAPIRFFYRPEPQTDLPVHPTTPLTTAIKQLRTHLDTLLADPDLAEKRHPEGLTPALEDAYLSIVATKGRQWHNWAKGVAKSKKTERLRVRAEEKRNAKAQSGMKRTTRRECGLDKYGKPLQGGKTEREVRSEKAALRREAKAREEDIRESQSTQSRGKDYLAPTLSSLNRPDWTKRGKIHKPQPPKGDDWGDDL